MSDLERAVEAAARAYYDWATTNDGEESRWEFPGRHQEFARARAQLMLQAALDDGEIVTAEDYLLLQRVLTECAEAAEQALVLANQDAEGWRQDAKRLARVLRAEGREIPSIVERAQQQALAAHGLRVGALDAPVSPVASLAQQEGT